MRNANWVEWAQVKADVAGPTTTGGEVQILEMTPERRAALGPSKQQRAWRESARRWRECNPGEARASGARRRARKLNAWPNDFTVEDWEEVLAVFEYECAYCGSPDKLEQEHVVPLVRGGSHTIANIVPACDHCNSVKGARTPAEAGMTMRRLPVVHFSLR